MSDPSSLPPIVFVGGPIRSGTTLLQRIISSSPSTTPMVSEVQYLSDQLDLFDAALAGFEVFHRDFFEDPADLAAFSRDLLVRFLARSSRRLGPEKVLVLKYPDVSRHFPLLAQWLPTMRFVMTVRDPRDVIASMIKVGEKQRANGQESLITAMGRDMRQLAEYFTSYYVPVLQNRDLFEGRLLWVRYEDLVQRLDESVAVLGAFCGVPLSREDVENGDHWRNPRLWKEFRDHPFFGAYWTDDWRGAVTAARVGGYRSVLSAPEIAAAQTHCAQINRVLGYW